MFERELPLLISAEKITEAMSSLGLTASVEYVNPSNTVATCALKNNAGSTVAEGAGKGSNCKLGASAESLEHFVLDQSLYQSLVGCTIDDIRRQPLLNMDGLAANLPESSAMIDCVEMTDMRSGYMARVPAVLQLPHRYLADRIQTHSGLSFLNRYSSNSGIAFGCSENEAILHGLNEVIERHILSKTLMSLCGQHEQLQLKCPSHEVLNKVFSAQTQLRFIVESMKILITKTIYGVYFSIAIPKRPDGRYPICPIGTGCSVDAHVAIERASTELLQVIELSDESERENDFRAYNLIQRSPALRPLAHLEKLRNIDYTCRRFDPPERIPVADQIDYIIRKISDTGLRILHRTLFKFDNACTVSQIYIPGMERFNLIRAGIPVVSQQLLHANKPFP